MFTDYEEDLSPRSDSTRIVTRDFPLYFAIVSRVRLDVAVIGTEGGVISSKVVPQVQAVFPSAALSKPTKVALQVRRRVICNGVFTRSSKRPANFQQTYSKYTC